MISSHAAPRRLSIATEALVLHMVVVLLVATVAAVSLVHLAGEGARRSAAERVLAVAQTFAAAPGTAPALDAPDPSEILQPVAEAVRRRAGIDFLVVTSPAGIRYTHPNPTLIGKHFIGHLEPARAGRPFTEVYTGTLGPSVRAVVPVFASDGSVCGLVAAGITLSAISHSTTGPILFVVAASVVTVLLSLAGAILLSRRIRRLTRGLGSADIARLYEHHDVMLHTVREGVLIIDGHGRLVLANDEARRLLDLPPGPGPSAGPEPCAGPDPSARPGAAADLEGRAIDDLGLDPDIAALLGSGRGLTDAALPVGDRLLSIDQRPTSPGAPLPGSIVTLRDTTRLRGLTGELDAVWGFAAALRAQTHEAGNRLHTVVTLVQLERYAQAVDFALAGISGFQCLTDHLLAAVDEPVLAALLLGKVAQAQARGVDLLVTDDTRYTSAGIDPADLVTLVGNLIDNAVDAALTGDPPPAEGPDPDGATPNGGRRVAVTVRADGGGCLVRVTDTGPGLPPDQVADAFRVGWTTKADAADGLPGRGIGLALVRQVVDRYAGSVTVDRDGVTVFTVRLCPHRPPLPGIGA